jgi:hypothetical protein
MMLLSGPKPVLMSVLLAVATFSWPGSNEAFSVASLENELVTSAEDCSVSDRCPAVAANVLTHWISRTNSGNLFLVLQTDCQATEHCAAWFVERTARGTATRLNIEGQFRVLPGNKAIPDVQTWRALSETEIEYTRYTWTAGAFVKMDTHTAYVVDGVECGSALECYQMANKAHAERNTGRALKIWEKVHNVSWI